MLDSELGAPSCMLANCCDKVTDIQIHARRQHDDWTLQALCQCQAVQLCRLTLFRGLPLSCLSFGALTFPGTSEIMLFHAELGERLVGVCQEH